MSLVVISSRVLLRRAALALLVALPATTTTCAESVLDAISAEVNAVYQKAKNAVVRVNAEGEGRSRSGTGFFIDASGKFVTTATVVGNARQTTIEWNHQQLSAELIGADPRANLALLRVQKEEGSDTQFPFLILGDAKALRVGTAVIAVGNPFDLSPSPSFGIVGGFDQHESAHIFVTSHIRTDMSLSPGESGSPLLNSRAEVVGILVASANQSETCYALPSHAIQRLVQDFDEFGEAKYGWIGMSVLQCSGDEKAKTKHGTCIKVQQVFSNTPAARAGIQTDDQILKIGGAPVRRLCDMLDTTFTARVGQKLNLEIQRAAMLTNLLVEIAERPGSLPSLKATPAAKND